MLSLEDEVVAAIDEWGVAGVGVACGELLVEGEGVHLCDNYNSLHGIDPL